jgi:hypothetical protein
MSRAISYDLSWRYHSDDDLRRWLSFYRRRLALFDEEIPEGTEFRDDTRAYLTMLVGDAEAEDAKRDRCATLGVPRDRQRFDELFLNDLKRRVMLDDLLIYRLNADLGKERNGKRQGPCPVCERGENCFTVYVTDQNDQHYYCFRCGTRGDCYGAMMQAYNCSFREAVEKLAAEINLPVPAAPRHQKQPDARLASLPGRVAD